MDSKEFITDLEKFRDRLSDVVIQVHSDYGFGIERWESFVNALSIYFDKNLKSYTYKIYDIANKKGGVIDLNDTMSERFRKTKAAPMDAFIRSLILDIKDGVIDQHIPTLKIEPNKIDTAKKINKKSFIVHGHDNGTKERTARFLEKLGIKPVILHEQASGGKTIIEKLEHFTDVDFGIVLYTPDDVGEAIAKKDQLRSRARQNVVFEHGLLIGKLGRDKVFPLVTDHNVELPGDISGMVYLSDSSWEFQLAKEIRALGYDVDLNNL